MTTFDREELAVLALNLPEEVFGIMLLTFQRNARGNGETQLLGSLNSNAYLLEAAAYLLKLAADPPPEPCQHCELARATAQRLLPVVEAEVERLAQRFNGVLNEH